MLPRVPREVRVPLVRTLLRVLVDYGLGDVEGAEYTTLADEFCSTIRNRQEKGAAASASC
jgi:hypothetical protein